jgi:hypothetical protein
MAFGFVFEGVMCMQPAIHAVERARCGTSPIKRENPMNRRAHHTHSNSTHICWTTWFITSHMSCCCRVSVAHAQPNIACVILPSSFLYLQLSVTSPWDYIITSDLSIFSPCFSIWNYSRNKNRRTRIWPAQFFIFCVIYIYAGFVQWWMGSGSTNPSDRIYIRFGPLYLTHHRVCYITHT